MNYLTPQTVFDGFMVFIAVTTIWAITLTSRRQAKSNQDSDALITIKLKDEAINQLTKEVERLNTLIIQDGKDIAVLKADNDRLTKLVENRDPALAIYMKESMEAMKAIQAGILQLLKAQTGSVTINN
jgi:uncharacterized ferredoxin-like protein